MRRRTRPGAVVIDGLYFPQQVYVTRQSYEGFVPIPAFGGIYQSMKAVRFTGR